MIGSKWFVVFLVLLCMLASLAAPFTGTLLAAAPLSAAAQSADETVARAVLFYSPNCGHCHYVINEVLVPMIGEYGDRLQIIAIDVTQPVGQQLYQSALEHFRISDQRRGVPMLFVGETILVGSAEIPDQFPAIVEQALAGGGIPWPEIPGLDLAFPDVDLEQPAATGTGADVAAEDVAAEDVAAEGAVAEGAVAEGAVVEPAPTSGSTGSEQDTPAEENTTAEEEPSSPVTPIDPQAAFVDTAAGEENALTQEEDSFSLSIDFILAIVVLMGMVIALVYSLWRLIASRGTPGQSERLRGAIGRTWAIPVLAIIGLGVSAYLAYVEITHVDAVCGPIGECNLVQSSAYATILGIPVAVLGMLSYLAIIALWLVHRYLGQRLGNWPAMGLLALTLFGTLFSIYLTLVELLVIQAICAWCLSSAVIATLLMLLVVIPLTKKPSSPRSEPPPVLDGAF